MGWVIAWKSPLEDVGWGRWYLFTNLKVDITHSYSLSQISFSHSLIHILTSTNTQVCMVWPGSIACDREVKWHQYRALIMSLGFFFLGDDNCVIYVLKVSLFGMEWSFASESCLLHLPQVLAKFPVLPCLKCPCVWSPPGNWERNGIDDTLERCCRPLIVSTGSSADGPFMLQSYENAGLPGLHISNMFFTFTAGNDILGKALGMVSIIINIGRSFNPCATVFSCIFTHAFPFIFPMGQFQYFCYTSLCYAKNISIKQYIWNTHHLSRRCFF